jgi:hypothetical protein
MSWVLALMQFAVLGTTIPQRPCLAADYGGATGGAKIQNAINDPRCGTVEIAAVGPDAGGIWSVATDIYLKSYLIVRGDSTGVKPTLQAIAPGPTAGVFRNRNGERLTSVVLRGLLIDGATTLAENAAWISGGCQTFTAVALTIQNMQYHGLHFNGLPCTDVLVTGCAFVSDGLLGVRTDTTVNTEFHARVVVMTNTFTGADYGVGLANCGSSANTGCAIVRNTINAPVISGIDLNLSHYALVSQNSITPVYRGITIDDSTYDTISLNSVVGGSNIGITIAGGAVAANSPWHENNIVVTLNTITSNGTGLYAGGAVGTDINDSNTWSFNVLTSNGTACAKTAAGVTNLTVTGNTGQACTP